MCFLNKRLQTWASDDFLISEEQAGFRKGYATVDNAFIQQSLIRNCLDRKRKLYVAFIDYKKVFDSINRNALWKILEQNGIDGKMLAVLKSIFNEVVSCVRSDIGTTKYFNCWKGLKQGCILSPIVFSYIIQVVTNEVCRRGGHGIQLHPDIIELSILLFADDIILIADMRANCCHIVATWLCFVMEVNWLQTNNGISVQLILTLCQNIHIWELSCQLA